MEEPKGTRTDFGSFRINIFYVPPMFGQSGGWRGSISGSWFTDIVADEKAARKLVIKEGPKALAKLNEALNEAGTIRR